MEEKYFLAYFTLRTSYYMSDKDSVRDVVRLIKASNEEEALIKLHKVYRVNYFDWKNSKNNLEFDYDYSSHNYFLDVQITEPIE